MDKKQSGVLAGIVGRMSELARERGKIEAEETVLWDEFYAIADDLVGEQQSFKFIALDLDPPQHLGRTRATSPTTVDPVLLRQLLNDGEWKIVTRQERVLDMERLTGAVHRNLIKTEDVQAATKGGGAYCRRLMVGPASNNEIKEARA